MMVCCAQFEAFCYSFWVVGNPSTTGSDTSRVRLDPNAIIDS